VFQSFSVGKGLRSSRIYSIGAVAVFGVSVFLLLKAGMATGGNFQLLQESALETGAESVDQPLTVAQNDISGLEPASWQKGASGVEKVTDIPAKVVLVSFWASYCLPCTREWPSMLGLIKSLGKSNLQMLAVSYDESWEPLTNFFRQTTGELPELDQAIVLRDPVQEGPEMLKTRYGTDKIPETYVVMNGRAVYRFVNERDWQAPEMRRFFKRLLDVAP